MPVKKERKMDSDESMITKSKRKKISKDFNKETEDHLKNLNTKMIIDFDCESSVSVNSLAVNKINVVKLTTQFFSGKLPMFAKLSLMSFIHDMIETFYLSNTKTKIIYRSYGIEKKLAYHILTGTDSTALHFHIFCSQNNSNDRFRHIIFEVIAQSDIIKRFDISNKF